MPCIIGLLLFPSQKIINLEDYLPVVVTENHLESVKAYSAPTGLLRAVKSCLKRPGLTLADEKTEAALFINRIKAAEKVEVGGHTVVIKYLGLIIQTKLNFRECIERKLGPPRYLQGQRRMISGDVDRTCLRRIIPNHKVWLKRTHR